MEAPRRASDSRGWGFPEPPHKLCVPAGGTGSGFLFDLGRVPYKGRRPLKDMIGSYKSRHSSGDPAPEGTPGAPGGAGGASRTSDPDVQQQVQSQQEELERLRKDLSSQKVTYPPPPPPPGSRATSQAGPSGSMLPGPWREAQPQARPGSDTREFPGREQTAGGSGEGVSAPQDRRVLSS